MEDEEDRLDAEISIVRKRQYLAELNKRGGQGFWKRFSSDGTKQGLNFKSIAEWLKNN